MTDINVNLSPQVINFLGIPFDDDFETSLTVYEVINDVKTEFDWTGATVLAEAVDNLLTPSPTLKFAFETFLEDGGVLRFRKLSADLNTHGVGSWYYSIRITKNSLTRTYFRGIFQRVATSAHDVS